MLTVTTKSGVSGTTAEPGPGLEYYGNVVGSGAVAITSPTGVADAPGHATTNYTLSPASTAGCRIALTARSPSPSTRSPQHGRKRLASLRRHYGTAVTFTATVSATGFDDGGTVQFAVGGVDLGSAASLNGSGVATSIADSDLPVTGSPYTVTATYSGDSGFGNSSGTLSGGETVTPATLDITANSTSKTYGQTVTLAGTAFTTGAGELFNGDTVTSVTLTSAGAAASATVAGSPYAIVASVAVGTGLGNYTISYHSGSLTVEPQAGHHSRGHCHADERHGRPTLFSSCPPWTPTTTS